MNPYQFTNTLLTTLKSLHDLQKLNSWIFKGETSIAYSSPTGPWDVGGFLFEKDDEKYSYILRSVPNEKGSSFIVLESVNMRGQLYNMDLNNPRNYIEKFEKTYLLESYRMTAGKGKVKEINVENAFKTFNIHTNEISVIDDKKPSWLNTISEILDWAVIRENVKVLLKNNKFKEVIEMPFQPAMTIFPLNQILYGPPGTGKTFNSINKAIEIINPNFDLTQDRTLIKSEYERLVLENQIVFTTFHQSMSYEDFIEGIKPETKDGNVTYDVIPGLFLELCSKAESNWEDSKQGNKTQLSFEEAFLTLKEEWDENEEIRFPLKRDGNDFTILGFTKKSIQFKKASGGTGHTLSINTLKDYYYKKREVRPKGVGIYYPAILDKLNSYQPTKDVEKKLKNYVIIIDEINRGNVSAIFGELITLIEEDKRLGKDEALEVMLPYSKEKFGVPPNVHILGTMNTADRSVEALDTALRRRFSFTEMMPDVDVVQGKNFQDFERALIMQKINQRIELLLDKNYTLGHSYFIKKDFKNSFENEIIPLLQEYFYNDCGKIGLILGKGFVQEKEISKKTNQSIFADFENKSEIDIIKSYELIPFTAVNFEDAIQTLLA